MNIRSASHLIAGIAAMQMAATASAQDAEVQDKGPGLIVFQDPADAPKPDGNPVTVPPQTETDPNDPRPVSLQTQMLIFLMLSNEPTSGDYLRKDLDPYNAKYPAPTDDIAAAIYSYESTRAEQRGACVADLPTKLKVTSSTAAPAVRQYIADKEITNAWIVSHKPKGCGKVPARVYTVAQGLDGEIIPIRMGDGETLINLNIHYDLSKLFRDNLLKFYASKKVDCEGQFIERPIMRIASKSGDWGKPFYGTYLSGKWREEWTFKGCGGTAMIPIDLKWEGATNTSFMAQFPEATFTPDS